MEPVLPTCSFGRVLCRDGVEVGAETFSIDGRSVAEHRDDRVRRDEPVASQRSEFADGRAVAGDDQRLSLVESTHDLTAVVAEFALGDRLCHATAVGRHATDVTRVRRRPVSSAATPRSPSRELVPPARARPFGG